MSATAAARTFLRSTGARTSAASRFAFGSKSRSKPAFSPFRISKQSTLSHRIFRTPVEISCCVETMLPYHTATASALLTSLLPVSHRSSGWTPEGLLEDKNPPRNTAGLRNVASLPLTRKTSNMEIIAITPISPKHHMDWKDHDYCVNFKLIENP